MCLRNSNVPGAFLSDTGGSSKGCSMYQIRGGVHNEFLGGVIREVSSLLIFHTLIATSHASLSQVSQSGFLCVSRMFACLGELHTSPTSIPPAERPTAPLIWGALGLDAEGISQQALHV